MKTYRLRVIVTGLSVIDCLATVRARNLSEAKSRIMEFYGKHFVAFE